MKISTLEDQSLRCLSQLARHPGGRLTIGAIAGAEGLTEESAAKVLARLRGAGLVKSFRGKDGGYELARPAERISAADVLGDIGGRLFELERCHGSASAESCVHHDDCGIRPVWLTLGQVVHSFLSSITLADLVDSERAVCRRLEDVVESLEIPGAPGVLPLQPLAASATSVGERDEASAGGDPS